MLFNHDFLHDFPSHSSFLPFLFLLFLTCMLMLFFYVFFLYFSVVFPTWVIIILFILFSLSCFKYWHLEGEHFMLFIKIKFKYFVDYIIKKKSFKYTKIVSINLKSCQNNLFLFIYFLFQHFFSVIIFIFNTTIIIYINIKNNSPHPIWWTFLLPVTF